MLHNTGCGQPSVSIQSRKVWPIKEVILYFIQACTGLSNSHTLYFRGKRVTWPSRSRPLRNRARHMITSSPRIATHSEKVAVPWPLQQKAKLFYSATELQQKKKQRIFTANLKGQFGNDAQKRAKSWIRSYRNTKWCYGPNSPGSRQGHNVGLVWIRWSTFP